jgi:hypothetical protein
MTHDEAKKAFFDGVPVVHGGIAYRRIEALYYERADAYQVKPNMVIKHGGGVFAVGAKMLDPNSGSVMCALVEKIKMKEEGIQDE